MKKPNAKNHSNPDADGPRTFRLASDCYRIGWFVLGACIACVAAIVGVGGETILNEEGMDICMAFFAVAALAAALWLLWGYTWRFRVDEEGIHNRVFFYWRHWPWNVVQPLTLNGLRNEDLKTVRALNAEFTATNTEDKAESIEISLNRKHKIDRKMRFLNTGFQGLDESISHVHEWPEVEAVEVVRVADSLPMVAELTLKTTAGELYLRMHENNGWLYSKNWIGPRLDLVYNFLQRHVTKERIVEMTFSEVSKEVAGIDERLEKLKEDRMGVSLCAVLAVAFLVATNVPDFIRIFYLIDASSNDETWTVMRGSAGLAAILLFSLPYILARRGIVREQAQLLSERRKLLLSTQRKGSEQ